MKNNKLVLWALLASVILILGFEISAGRIRFGAAYWNDSTTSIITGNKNMLVNGEVTARDSIDAGNGLRTDEIYLDGVTPALQWNTYGMNITGGLDQLEYNANAHYFATEYATTLFGADSANGFSYINPNIGWGGDKRIKTKLVKFATTSGSLPAYVLSAHGLTGSTIINANCTVRADTTGWNISGSSSNNDNSFPPRFPVSTAATYDFFYDETNLIIYLASTATAIRNNTDTAFVWITYFE